MKNYDDSTPNGRPLCDAHGETDTGKTRNANEDQFMVGFLQRRMTVPQTSLDLESSSATPNDGVLLLVADGVGDDGHGAQASALAARTLHEHLLENIPWNLGAEGTEEDFLQLMSEALVDCQKQLTAREGPSHRLATTLTAACVFWPAMYLAHVGDSRCYRIRDRRIQRMTKDHTVAQEFIDKGIISPQEAQGTKLQHVLWNAIGGQSTRVRPEISKHLLEPGDRIVLCTDGVTRHLTDQRLLSEIHRAESAQKACRSVIDTANELGGKDNATVIAAFFDPEARVTATLNPVDGPSRSRARRLEPAQGKPEELTAEETFRRGAEALQSADPVTVAS